MTAAGEEGKIHIYGNLDTHAAKEFIVKVLKGTEGAFTGENAIDGLIALEQKRSDIDGSFAFDIPISSETSSGEYLILLTMEKSRTVDKSIPFYYLSQTERDEIIESLNRTETVQVLQKEVLEHTKELNIMTEELYNSLEYPTGVFEKMFQRKKEKSFENLEEIQQSFRESCVLEAVQESESAAEVLERIVKYKDVLGIDPTSTQSLKNPQEVGERILSEEFTSILEIQTRFSEAVCVSAFNQATRSEMQALIDTYASQLNLPSAYTSATEGQKNALYKSLESIKNFNLYEDITKYIKKWLNTESGTGGSGGGGGRVNSTSGIISGGLGTGMTEESQEQGGQNNSSSALTPGTKFTDIKDVPWAIEAIEYLANQKIIQGVRSDSFEPNRFITREEFVKILVEAFGVARSDVPTKFADIDQNAWYASYVSSAVEKGIVQGIDDQNFGVGAEITRQDMAVMICRAINLLEKKPEETLEMPAFDDAAEIAEYAKEAVGMLCRSGVMNGVSETEFAPNGYDWNVDTWAAGDKTYEDLSYILLLDKSVQQPYIDATINWLNNQQNPETGYWNNSGDIGFNAVSGAFKVSRIYDRFGICPPNAMQLANTVIDTLRGGYTATAACYVRNPLSTLQILMKHDAEVQAAIMDLEPEIVELYVKMIHNMFHEDGGASSIMYRSNTKFGGLVAGRMLCEGDMDGTLQMSIARTHLSQIFGRNADKKYLAKYSEEFWNKMMEKKPIIKKSYTAASGVIVDEDFEDTARIEDLFAEKWSFRSGNVTLPNQNINGKQNRYLFFDDTGETDLECVRCAFDKVYDSASIEFSAFFDRNLPYQEKKNDMSYSYFSISCGELMVLSINALDGGSDKVTLACQNSKSGTTTYNGFATVNRGEWFHFRLDFSRDQNGRWHTKCYLNGKLQPAAEDALLTPDAEYIDSFEIRSSTTRCSKIGLDDLKVTVK